MQDRLAKKSHTLIRQLNPRAEKKISQSESIF